MGQRINENYEINQGLKPKLMIHMNKPFNYWNLQTYTKDHIYNRAQRDI